MAHKMLDGHHGWRFFHHLGHGIGLSSHEAPRLNPNWDESFQVGDVFTLEPGLYGDELQAGLRIEENYLLTAAGPEKLSSFPIALA
jgi:Xaa-Pro aminopeptidase